MANSLSYQVSELQTSDRPGNLGECLTVIELSSYPSSTNHSRRTTVITERQLDATAFYVNTAARRECTTRLVARLMYSVVLTRNLHTRCFTSS